MQQIGVFGASFNPPTLGHQDVLSQALPQFDKVLLVPAWSHPFGKQLISIEHRLQMLSLFISEDVFAKQRSKISISTIEGALFEQHQNQGPIYTYDVLSALQASFQDKAQLHFILGPDNSTPQVWQKFYRYQEIEQRWPLFIAKENVAIHSTMVRKICQEYPQAQDRIQKLAALVGDKIARYIEEQQLYRDKEKAHG